MMKPQNLNNYDILKFIAIVTMVVDHVGMFFFPEISYYRALGRMAFPLFLFLVGYSEKYVFSQNLLFFGILLSLLKIVLDFYSKEANILITIFLTRILFSKLKSKEVLNNYFYELVISFSAFFILTKNMFEYGTLAFLFAYLGYCTKNNKSLLKTNLLLIYCLIINFVLQYGAFSFEDNKFVAIFIISNFFLYYLFNNFSLKKIEIKPKIVSNSIRLIARNSLNVYIVHFVLFALLAKLVL